MSDLRPMGESYWVEAGKLLAGEHPGHWDERVARRRVSGLLDAGIRTFVDLSGRGDNVHPYVAELESICGDRGIDVDYLRRPLREEVLPDRAEDVAYILQDIKSAIESGRRVYVHCSEGVGRTGLVVGCWLVERGFDPEDALDELARRFATMNKAKYCRITPTSGLQAEWVENWHPRLGQVAQRSQAG